MPQKTRDLVKKREAACFVNRGGKGSHRNYEHDTGVRVTVSGRLGDDAKRYQEREVEHKVAEVSNE
ncbi:MAG: type II toxin-antitoxin system HicA family toxin [Planctomycetota bacterium]